MKRLKSSNKYNKGFTLVELIVVIVILAILAAILIPALLGYIDKSKSGKVVLEAKYAYQDAQSALVQFYAKEKTVFKDYYEVCHSKGRNSGYTDADGVFHPACVITQSSLSTIQQVYRQKGAKGLQEHLASYKSGYQAGDRSSAFSYSAHAISYYVLAQMDALDQKTSEYKFMLNTRASEITYDEYYNANPSKAEQCNPLIYQLYFDDQGKILMFEYGKDGYLVRMENGVTTVEKNGKTYKSNN